MDLYRQTPGGLISCYIANATLGAGYGRWLVKAAVALRQISDIPMQLIGVEAEPNHFKMMKQHFLNNNVDINCATFIEAAVSASDGHVHFFTGKHNVWFGQRITHAKTEDAKMEGITNVRVKAISLKSLLKQCQYVDLIDLDIQGAEYGVIKACTRILDKKVRRIHIGTHSEKIEKDIRATFSRLGWRKVYDFSCFKENNTPYGKIEFGDGVQSWINDKITRPSQNESKPAPILHNFFLWRLRRRLSKSRYEQK